MLKRVQSNEEKIDRLEVFTRVVEIIFSTAPGEIISERMLKLVNLHSEVNLMTAVPHQRKIKLTTLRCHIRDVFTQNSFATDWFSHLY